MKESPNKAQLLARMSATDKQQLLAGFLRRKSHLHKVGRKEAASYTYMDDAVLDPAIQAIGPPPFAATPGAVLLTGATGFLGAHLLEELCTRTGATIYCLVRAENIPAALLKLQTNFSHYFAHKLDLGRVRPILGDLAQPQLGLSPETFAMLAREIDTVFHNGAQMHHLAPYAQLKASNVSSTAALLQLATTVRAKRLHYVSTLVAAVERDSHGWLTEDFPRAASAELAGGYSQSKWVCERLLEQAARRDIGVTVFRPGFISGRSDNGAWPNPNDHLVRVILGCLQMGCAPASALSLDIAPVDFIGAAIVRIALTEAAAGHVFNLSNPEPLPWSTLLQWLHSLGYQFEVVPTAEWRETYLPRIDVNNALFPVLPLYMGGDTTARHAELLSKLSKIRRTRTADALSRLPMPFPIAGEALWRGYMQCFEDCGFLRSRSSVGVKPG